MKVEYSDLLDSVDASVFSGELLFTNLTEFEDYLERWLRAVKEHKELCEEEK